MGERFARILHAAGAHLVVAARRGHLLEALQSDCGGAMEVVVGDIADPRHREALTAHIAARHGRLDILVSNAGIADDGALEHQALADLDRVIEVNLTSVLDVCRLAAPLLFAAPSASVVNVASMYGVVGDRGAMAGYNATKGAVVNLSRHLAAQTCPTRSSPAPRSVPNV